MNIQRFRDIVEEWYHNIQSTNSTLDFKAVPLDFMVHEPFLCSILNYKEAATFELDEEISSIFMLLHTECLQKRRQVLFNLLPDYLKHRSSGEISDSNQVVPPLASIWFKHRSTFAPRGYSSMLDQVKTSHPFDKRREMLALHYSWFDHRYSYLQNTDIVFDHDAHQLAIYIIECSGKDPNTTTEKTMNSLDIKFICNRCATPTVYTWDNAVNASLLSLVY